MATVSVIIPVCDEDVWFQKAIDSVNAQTYKDIEMIVVDDFARTGAAAARNRGIERSTGDYLVFCDADDYMEPDAVENLMSSDADLVCGSFRKFGKFSAVVSGGDRLMNRREVAQYALENLRNPMHYQMLSGCWAKRYKRSLIGRFPLIHTAEDMAFNYEYLMASRTIRFISKVVYNNQKRDGSLTTTFDPAKADGLFGFADGLKRVERFLLDNLPRSDVEPAIDKSMIYHSILYFMRICEYTVKPMREVLMDLYK